MPKDVKADACSTETVKKELEDAGCPCDPDCCDKACECKKLLLSAKDTGPVGALDWTKVIAAVKKWGPVVFDIIMDLLKDDGVVGQPKKA